MNPRVPAQKERPLLEPFLAGVIPFRMAGPSSIVERDSLVALRMQLREAGAGEVSVAASSTCHSTTNRTR